MSNVAWPETIKNSSAAHALENALEQKRLGHGLLFVADRFETADDAALALATCLIETQVMKEFPGRIISRSASTSSAVTQADYLKVQPTNKQRQIGVDPMRELREFLQMGSLSGVKVAHISQADRLGTTAANLFLKILEEPPADAYIIMTTAEPYGVLPTLVSRAMRFRFSSDEVGRTKLEAVMRWCEDFKDFLQSDARAGLMPRMVLIDSANKILAKQEDEAEDSESDEDAAQEKVVREALAVAKQKAVKREFFASLEDAVLELYKENPRESIALTQAMKGIERSYQLTEMNLNTAAAVEAAINAVAEAFQ